VENITVSFSASCAPDKVKSKSQMNTCEVKTQKRPLTAGFLRFSPVFSIGGNQASHFPSASRETTEPESGLQIIRVNPTKSE
jgi:hypothetical protein